jgi:hypothetical protein
MNDDLLQQIDGDWDGSPEGGLTDLAIAAAAYELAMLAGAGGRATTVAPMPAGLAAAIGRAAAPHVSRKVPVAGAAGGAWSEGTSRPQASVTEFGEGRWQRLVSLAGWCVAAGLGLVLLTRLGTPPRDGIPRGPEAVAVRPATPEQLRERLLADDPDAIEVAWADGTDPAVATQPAGASRGDVVWSQRLQRGSMRFRGLAANDPAVEQYQLWIFDAERDAAHPVDGGVFDVAGTDADGEVCVPIDARLPIGKPTLFAITVEKPGGVVVSKRDRLPLLAKVP